MKMYGSLSDEDLNEWERLPLVRRVLCSAQMGAWLLRRDENKEKSEHKTGRWIDVEVLDKIRAEIERKAHSGQWSDATMYGMLKAIAIIDKYKAESEDKE